MLSNPVCTLSRIQTPCILPRHFREPLQSLRALFTSDKCFLKNTIWRHYWQPLKSFQLLLQAVLETTTKGSETCGPALLAFSSIWTTKKESNHLVIGWHCITTLWLWLLRDFLIFCFFKYYNLCSWVDVYKPSQNITDFVLDIHIVSRKPNFSHL